MRWDEMLGDYHSTSYVFLSVGVNGLKSSLEFSYIWWTLYYKHIGFGNRMQVLCTIASNDVVTDFT